MFFFAFKYTGWYGIMCYNKAENAGIIVARKRQVSEAKY